MNDNAIPIKNGFFLQEGAEPKLLISKCKLCNTPAFPQTSYCPNCASDQVEVVQLGSRGKLRNFTKVRNMPPECRIAVPYGVGIAEFPEYNIRIMGLLTIHDLSKLRPGMEIKLVVGRVYEEQGQEVFTYKFQPVEEGI